VMILLGFYMDCYFSVSNVFQSGLRLQLHVKLLVQDEVVVHCALKVQDNTHLPFVCKILGCLKCHCWTTLVQLIYKHTSKSSVIHSGKHGEIYFCSPLDM
jgi:hypothetical protein